MDDAALVRSVEARLGRRVFESDGALMLRVALDRRGANWVAELSLSDEVGPLGERSLSTRASHCSALDESLALVVALLVDTPPQRPPPVAPAEQLPSKSVAPTPSPPRAPTPLIVPEDTFAPRAPWQFAARAGGSLSIGVLPGLGYGPQVGLSAHPPHGPWLQLNLDLALAKERRTADGTRGVRISSERAALLLCTPLAEKATLEWRLCAGQRVGRLTAEGLGFDQSFRIRRLYWAAVLGAEFSFPLATYLYLPVGLFAEIPLTRDQFVAREVPESLHDIGPVTGLATLAIEFREGS